MADLRPALTPIFRDFGVPATITPPGGVAIAITVVLDARGSLFPVSGELAVHELRRTVALRRDEVASVRIGTTIATAVETLTVDGINRQDDEIVEVLVR